MNNALGLVVLLALSGGAFHEARGQDLAKQAVDCFDSFTVKPSLDPLRKKLVLAGNPKATLEMQADASKPDGAEKFALSSWATLRDECFAIAKRSLEAGPTLPSVLAIILQSKDLADAVISELYRGELTFGEYNVKQMARFAEYRRRVDEAVEIARREAVATQGSSTQGSSAPPPPAPVATPTRNLEQDRYQCEQDAVRSYPVAMTQRMTDPGFQVPSHLAQRQSQTNCTMIGNQLRCNSAPSGVDTSIYNRPPSYVTEDANLQNRLSAFRSCMVTKGYTPR